MSGYYSHENDKELQAFFARKDLIHFVALMDRPGVSSCLQTLEYKHYPPLTPENNKFHLRLTEWHNIHWIIASIPHTDSRFMRSACATENLRIANGVPHIIRAGKLHIQVATRNKPKQFNFLYKQFGDIQIDTFPFAGLNVYTLEHLSDSPATKQPWNIR